MTINRNKNIAIFHNLPKGGGLTSLENINKNLSNKYKIKYYSPKNISFNSFFHYLKYVFYDLKKIHKKIAQEIDEDGYSLVIVYHDYLTKAPYLLRYLHTQSIYMCQEEPREFYLDKKYLSSNFKNWLINFIRTPLKNIDYSNTKKASILLTNSLFSKQKLESIYKRKFQVLYPGVDETIFEYSNLKRKNYYLTIASTSIFKGIDFLIKSIALLPKDLQYKLVIIGNKGRDDKYINKLAKKYGIKIERKYDLDIKEVVKYYQNAKLLLSAAINEPFGLSLLESVSCGTKLVIVKEGGYEEIFRSGKNIGSMTLRDTFLFSQEIINQVDKIINKKNRDIFVNKWKWDLTLNNLEKYINSNL